jgi:hypothetical protein
MQLPEARALAGGFGVLERASCDHNAAPWLEVLLIGTSGSKQTRAQDLAPSVSRADLVRSGGSIRTRYAQGLNRQTRPPGMFRDRQSRDLSSRVVAHASTRRF